MAAAVAAVAAAVAAVAAAVAAAAVAAVCCCKNQRQRLTFQSHFQLTWLPWKIFFLILDCVNIQKIEKRFQQKRPKRPKTRLGSRSRPKGHLFYFYSRKLFFSLNLNLAVPQPVSSQKLGSK